MFSFISAQYIITTFFRKLILSKKITDPVAFYHHPPKNVAFCPRKDCVKNGLNVGSKYVIRNLDPQSISEFFHQNILSKTVKISYRKIYHP